ncbi:hypothetical protein LMG28727_02948 [Paraburkholderia kirstenboschensis]|nr:hypothetical protein LMG28727_02948 [Paraburkholderia kirstenboschensis]
MRVLSMPMSAGMVPIVARLTRKESTAPDLGLATPAKLHRCQKGRSSEKQSIRPPIAYDMQPPQTVSPLLCIWGTLQMDGPCGPPRRPWVSN